MNLNDHINKALKGIVYTKIYILLSFTKADDKRGNFLSNFASHLFFEQCDLGTFRLRMGNKFLSGLAVGPVSYLVAH